MGTNLYNVSLFRIDDYQGNYFRNTPLFQIHPRTTGWDIKLNSPKPQNIRRLRRRFDQNQWFYEEVLEVPTRVVGSAGENVNVLVQKINRIPH